MVDLDARLAALETSATSTTLTSTTTTAAITTTTTPTTTTSPTTTTAPTTTTIPTTACTGVQVSAGSNLVTVASANPAGATFCLASAVYQISTPIPFQTGDRWIGALGSGGQRLSVITGNDTTDYLVTAATANVTLRNVIVEHFANALQQGVNTGSQTAWLLDNIESRFNKAFGWHTHDDTVVRNSYIHHNHQAGLGGQGDRVIVEGTEVSFNNWLGEHNWGWEAGGSKWVNTVNFTVRTSRFISNCGPGIWTDGSNSGVLYEGNEASNNYGPGIFHEIGGSAIIRGNTVAGNAWGAAGGLCANASSGYAGGILISESHPVEVYGNTLTGNAGGIIAIDNNRGTGVYVADLYVHDNDITVTDATGDAAAGCYDFGTAYNCYANRNRFEANTYHVGTDPTPFYWAGAERSFVQWQGYGFDLTGSID